MRKTLISIAAAASALAFASPSAAQWAPQGNAYGYQNNYGQARNLLARVDRLQRDIVMLRDRRALSRNEAQRLRDDARNLERRLRVQTRNGLHPRERYDIEVRLARLEQRIARDVRDGNRRYGYGNQGYGNQGYGNQGYGSQGYGYQGGWDRDRDGRDDRYEDDRGNRPG
jgi:hypothetical protein